jgi:hypothetical protein
MKIEHIGFLVSEPISMGNWYKKHLNLKIIKSFGNNEEGAVFLKDVETGTILEFGKLKEIPNFNYNELDPLQVHIAIECKDPLRLAKKLESAGAVIIGDSPKAEANNERILLKDPWDFTIQLINRVSKLEE